MILLDALTNSLSQSLDPPSSFVGGGHLNPYTQTYFNFRPLRCRRTRNAGCEVRGVREAPASLAVIANIADPNPNTLTVTMDLNCETRVETLQGTL